MSLPAPASKYLANILINVDECSSIHSTRNRYVLIFVCHHTPIGSQPFLFQRNQGGSIGSALAVLAFYPLERVRVELQSSGLGLGQRVDRRDGGHVEANNAESTDTSIERQHGIEYQHPIHFLVMEDSDPKGTDHEGENDGGFSTPTSSSESFELVSTPNFSYIEQGGDEERLQLASDISTDQLVYNDVLVYVKSSSDYHSSHGDIIETPATAKCAHQNSNQTRHSKFSESILQCLLRLYKQKTLYNGASHMTTTLMISNFIFFYALQVCRRSMSHLQLQQNQSKSRWQQHKSSEPSKLYSSLYQFLQSKMVQSLLSSTIAGMMNVIITNPLWVASLRIMEGKEPPNSKHPVSIWSVIHCIAKTEGVQQLWSGTWTSLLLVSNPIIQHFVYEQMRSWLLETKQRQSQSRGITLKSPVLTPIQAFFFGAFAKAVATVMTYPLQLAQVLLRLQTKRIASSDKDKGTNESNECTFTGAVDCLHHQFANGGMSALFRGMDAKLIQTVLTSAFTFLTYEQVLVLVARLYDTLT
jgi:adenine nucleotide transporter 17